MPKPREQQVCIEATPYYHCVSRCVRKAFLCGIDYDTGKSYEYRRDWIEEELLKHTSYPDSHDKENLLGRPRLLHLSNSHSAFQLIYKNE